LSRVGRVVRRLDEHLFLRHLAIYPKLLQQELAGEWNGLLDVGCGEASPIAGTAALGAISGTVGIDSHVPAVERCRRTGPYERYEPVAALAAAEVFGPASFDVVMALDVIEHLEKEDGRRLLDVLETVARRRVIIFTPNGFLPQGALEGNPFQVHRSGWWPEEFLVRGYRVVGVNGWRALRGEEWKPRVRPHQLGDRLSAATQPFVTHHPHRAFALLAVRDQPA
jgi:hypothetical protein